MLNRLSLQLFVVLLFCYTFSEGRIQAQSLAEQIGQAEAQLNDVYLKAYQKLNDEQRDSLMKDQLAWIKLKDAISLEDPNHLTAILDRIQYLENYGQTGTNTGASQTSTPSGASTPVSPPVTPNSAQGSTPPAPATPVTMKDEAGNTYLVSAEDYDRLFPIWEQLDTENKFIVKLQAEADQARKKIVSDQASLDHNNDAAVDACNDEVTRFNTFQEALDKKVASFNVVVGSFNADVHNCGRLMN